MELATNINLPGAVAENAIVEVDENTVARRNVVSNIEPFENLEDFNFIYDLKTKKHSACYYLFNKKCIFLIDINISINYY